MAGTAYFTAGTFKFLRELKENNNREWFNDNKPRYERYIKEPALQFIMDFGPHLAKISPHFKADPRVNGGSLFRIYRDTRFGKNKAPYKNNTGLHFRHMAGKDAHAPGFYLHIEPGQVFMGTGIWRPDSPTLRKIREAIVEDPKAWKRASNAKRFKDNFELTGDSLVRAPKGFDPEHPLIEDLRRKDFIGVTQLTQKAVTGPDFMKEFTSLCKASGPFQKWLCGAVGVDY